MSRFYRSSFQNLVNDHSLTRTCEWLLFSPNYEPCCDDFLQPHDTKNIAAKHIMLRFYRFLSDDQTIVSMWVTANHGMVWYHSSKLFTLGIQTPFQNTLMLHFCQNSVISVDATFGTKKYVFYLYTFPVFDNFQNQVLVAWVIIESGKMDDIQSLTWLLTF